jgi:hypothetical protein
MLQSSGVETGLVILPVIDTTVARLKVITYKNMGTQMYLWACLHTSDVTT